VTTVTSEKNFLEIKDWETRQCKDRKGRRIHLYIKDYCGKEGERDYSRLTCFQRYVFDAVCRLRGRLGRNPENDATWIARALNVTSTERPCVSHALRMLIARGFLAVTNQELSLPDSDSDSDSDSETDGKGVSAGSSKVQMEVKKGLNVVWDYYLSKLDKDPAITTPTPLRRQMGLARFAEAMEKCGEDPAKATILMKCAIDALAKSAFHNGKNDTKSTFTEWENMFCTTEKFEQWLGRAAQ
jgi:hypothetical protein